eukprot:Selendium_serpulae@DN3485_c0_g1_i3.p1
MCDPSKGRNHAKEWFLPSRSHSRHVCCLGLRFIADARGVFMCLMTWAIYASSLLCIHKFIYPSCRYIGAASDFFVLFLDVAAFMGLLSHLRAATTDPGTHWFKEAPRTFRKWRACPECGETWKPPRSHHCKLCQQLVGFGSAIKLHPIAPGASSA